MGMYDYLPKGSQVKLWDCTLKSIKIGDIVPSFDLPEYVVLLREGGYVRVEKGIIFHIEETEGKKYYYPEDFPDIPCLDKYGNQVSSKEDLAGQFQGFLGFEDPYYPMEKKGGKDGLQSSSAT